MPPTAKQWKRIAEISRHSLSLIVQNRATLERLEQHIEALIFVAESPITLKEIQSCLNETFEVELSEEEIRTGLNQLMERYTEERFSIEIVEIADGFQFLSKGAFHNTIGTYLKQTTQRRLSRSALETISIIAYKQPVTKGELETIRGVSCDYTIQKLLEKELVTIVGRSEGPGRPLLYGTSEKFMNYFGLKSIKDLPKPKEFSQPENSIGEQAPIEEEVTPDSEES